MKELVLGMLRPKTTGEHITALGFGGNIGIIAAAIGLTYIQKDLGFKVLTGESIIIFQNLLTAAHIFMDLLQVTGLVGMMYLESDNCLKHKSNH